MQLGLTFRELTTDLARLGLIQFDLNVECVAQTANITVTS